MTGLFYQRGDARLFGLRQGRRGAGQAAAEPA
jgi:hypothetical protein